MIEDCDNHFCFTCGEEYMGKHHYCTGAPHEVTEQDEIRTLRAKLAEAAKIIKPFADMRPLCGENEREAILARMLGGVDHAWEDRRVCLEVRHLTDAYNWIKENGNE